MWRQVLRCAALRGSLRGGDDGMHELHLRARQCACLAPCQLTLTRCCTCFCQRPLHCQPFVTDLCPVVHQSSSLRAWRVCSHRRVPGFTWVVLASPVDLSAGESGDALRSAATLYGAGHYLLSGMGTSRMG